MRLILMPLMLLTACALEEAGELDEVRQAAVSDSLDGIYSKYFLVKERLNNRCLDIRSTDEAWVNGNCHQGDNQQFLVIPIRVNANQFFLVPKHDGGVIDARSNGTLYMFDNYPHGGANQYQYFYNTDYVIRNALRSGNFDARGNGSIHLGSPHGQENQQFSFEPVSDIPFGMPPTISGAAPGQIGDVPRIDSYSSTPPLMTTPVLIGEGPIPFLFVRTLDRDYQVRNTPYYTMRREQYWKRVEMGEKPADASQSWTYMARYGMSRSESITIESTYAFNFKMTGELTFTNEGLKQTLGSTLETQNKVVTTLVSSSTYTEERTEQMSFSIPVGVRVRWAAWHLVDRYSVIEMDGRDVVDQWELVYRDQRVVDAYPR